MKDIFIYQKKKKTHSLSPTSTKKKVNEIVPSERVAGEEKENLQSIYETVLNRVPFHFKSKYYFYWLIGKFLCCC